jgi:DNA mismatch repair protein MutS
VSETAGEFASVLFPGGEELQAGETPSFFRDLNFDAIVDAVAKRRKEYPLKPFFAVPLRSVDEIQYRHEVFRDLERAEIRRPMLTFVEEAFRVGRYLELVRKQHHRLEKQRWLLDAAVRYVEAVHALHDTLAKLDLRSHGLRGWRDFLSSYTRSTEFEEFAAETRAVAAGLDRVRYTIRIKGNRVTVGDYHEEPDYSTEVEETFARFRQGEIENRLAVPSDPGSMDHVEAQVVQRVARLYPDEFAALDTFARRRREFVHPVVARFEREVQFYLAWLEHVDDLRGHGIDFSYPKIAASKRESGAEAAVDLALATQNVRRGTRVVPNDFELREVERILVVSGPNQGGKTTFARMFGQLHQLARLGVPVPARSACLFLADEIYTHFEREENVAALRGKLDDELLRLKEILEQASADSVIILNEIFASTTLADAVVLGTDVLSRLAELGCLAVCVTFVDELASLGGATVSMVATVEPEDPSIRTFRVVRRPADGRAYASALAEKYGLSYEGLKGRVEA